MWHVWNGGGYGWWWLGMLGMALFWGVVIVAIIIAVRALGDRARYAGPPGPPRETPLEILRRRYASGEIDKREFEEKKRDLLS
jgi:putative membrane protein